MFNSKDDFNQTFYSPHQIPWTSIAILWRLNQVGSYFLENINFIKSTVKLLLTGNNLIFFVQITANWYLQHTRSSSALQS